MPVHARLFVARRRAAEVDPAVDTVELEIERPPVRTVGLAMTAPAVDKAMGPGGDPFRIVSHGFYNLVPPVKTRK